MKVIINIPDSFVKQFLSNLIASEADPMAIMAKGLSISALKQAVEKAGGTFEVPESTFNNLEGEAENGLANMFLADLGALSLLVTADEKKAAAGAAPVAPAPKAAPNEALAAPVCFIPGLGML